MDTLYRHIERRVKELGYSKFSAEPVLIKTSVENLKYKLSAFNELYFLVSELTPGSRVISDTNALEVDVQFNSSMLRSFLEFSGNIEITLSDYNGKAIEFLRIIPQE